MAFLHSPSIAVLLFSTPAIPGKYPTQSGDPMETVEGPYIRVSHSVPAVASFFSALEDGQHSSLTTIADSYCRYSCSATHQFTTSMFLKYSINGFPRKHTYF